MKNRLILSTLLLVLLAACRPEILDDQQSESSSLSSNAENTLQAASLTINSIGSGSTNATFTAPKGTVYSSVSLNQGANFLGTKICTGTTIFGLAGTSSCVVPGTSTLTSIAGALASNASRTKNTTQLTVSAEVTTYAGLALPSTGGYSYREVPDSTIDDDGYLGGSVTYASRPGTDCGYAAVMGGSGLNPALISDRIQHCLNLNTSAVATWDGTVKGNTGQGIWKLVTRSGASKEVWQDQRTGLLWSTPPSAGANWCRAAGSTQNGGGMDCGANSGTSCGGSPCQPVPAISYCAESNTFAAGYTGEVYGTNAGTSTYVAEKGYLGIYSSPAVRWRLPTINDYKQAEVNGVRFVLPGMGVGASFEHSAFGRGTSGAGWGFFANNGSIDFQNKSTAFKMRCVGR